MPWSIAEETKMKLNVGSVDKVIRIVLGVVLLGLIVVLDGNVRWIGLIGVVPLMTGLAGYCPLYTLLGINTCQSNTKHA
jgi:hypothetical protein